MAAITPQFPLPLPPWARWGLRALPLVWATAEALLEHAGTVQTNGDLVWRRAVVVWTRGEPGPSPEDHAVCTFDLANVTNSEIDGSWDAGDYATSDQAFQLWASQLANHQSTAYAALEVRYYRMQFNSPMTAARRFIPSGPPEHVFPLVFPGLLTGDALPPQVAMSVTERTAVPRHWGRFYIPGLTEQASSGTLGRFSNGSVDAAAGYTDTLYATLAAAELFPVVVSTQTDKILAGSLLGVTSLQVDNIPDTIRRRRHSLSTYTKILP